MGIQRISGRSFGPPRPMGPAESFVTLGERKAKGGVGAKLTPCLLQLTSSLITGERPIGPSLVTPIRLTSPVFQTTMAGQTSFYTERPRPSAITTTDPSA